MMWRSASTVRSTFVLMMVFLLPLVTGSVRGTAEGKNSKMNIAAPLNEIDLENVKLIPALNDTIKLNQGRVEDWSNKKLPINNTDDDLDQALSDPSTIWPNGRVPYILDSLFKSDERAILAEVFAAFAKETCVRFVDRSTLNPMPSIYLTIQRYPDDNYYKCEASQGMSVVGANAILSRRCMIQFGQKVLGDVMHEFMHVLGFTHEMSRTDRDDYVTIVWSNMQSDPHVQAQFYIQQNTANEGTQYDYNSLMHYGKGAGSKDLFGTLYTIITKDPAAQDVIGQRTYFSKGDILKINTHYKCSTTARPTTAPTTTVPATIDTCYRCDNKYNPNEVLCGSDGVTYPNLFCFLRAHCLSKWKMRGTAGACPPIAANRQQWCKLLYEESQYCEVRTGCPCQSTFFPTDAICGSDGVFYNNSCLFNKAWCMSGSFSSSLTGKYLKDGGSCTIPTTTIPPTTTTPATIDTCYRCDGKYIPTEVWCGSDGVTYPNWFCFLRGRCLSNWKLTGTPGNCPAISSDKTKWCKMLYEESPVCEVRTGCPCQTTFYPTDAVCGNDGKLYNNSCLFNKQWCLTGSFSSKLVGKYLKDIGSCSNFSFVLPTTTTTTIKPTTTTTLTTMTTASTTTVNPNCPYICDAKVGQVICGTDGVTYNNLCLFKKAACLSGFTLSGKQGAC